MPLERGLPGSNPREQHFWDSDQVHQTAWLHVVAFCVLSVQVSIPDMHGVEIITLGPISSFDTALLLPIFERAVFLELCNSPEVDLLFCCFMLSRVMVVRVMSQLQCWKSFSRRGAGYVSLLRVCPDSKDSARAFSMVASAFLEGM
jgi:hypothetical protein